MRKKPSIWVSFLIMFFGILAVAGYIVFNAIETNNTFCTSFYAISSEKVSGSVRIVELADLHLKQYGEDNADLVARIAELKPDIIAMAGDMTLQDTDEHAVVVSLIKQLSGIAPIFYSAGNHEMAEILFNSNSTLIDDIVAAGAVYLDNTYEITYIDGTPIAIGGVCKNRSDMLKYSITVDMLRRLSDEDCFTVLLSHYPEGFIDGNMDEYPFDLVLCGHAHGGQIRLPKIGGLYTNDQGFLPDYTEGLIEMSGSNVVISRGLGDSSSYIPRINNQPELVVIDLN